MAKTKAVGDVLGISRGPARKKAKPAGTGKAASASRPAGARKSTRRRTPGIEVTPSRPMKRAGVVGGVRGLGR